MKILRLTLKKEWFDMIASGVKKEEYREVKPYWENRLTEECDCGFDACDECDSGGGFKVFDVIEFKNGYGNHVPAMRVAFKGIEKRGGNPKWGAVKGETYFVIHLGEVLEVSR